MGGYAAIRFADAAGANVVLALSPQYSIDPQKMPSETRWLQDSQRIAWRPEIDGRIICGVRPVVVFDPLEDGDQVAKIQDDIDIWPIRLPYVSHPASTYLAETGLLKVLVLQTRRGFPAARIVFVTKGLVEADRLKMFFLVDRGDALSFVNHQAFRVVR